MDQKTLREFEAKCVQDEAPACQASCPIHLDARTFIKHMAENNIRKARIELDKYMPLSSLSALLCEGDCKNSCKMKQLGDAIDMPLLERRCVLSSEATRIMAIPSNGKKIAIGGSALSSLCLAFEMAKKGFAVSLYYCNEIAQSIKEEASKKGSDFLPEEALQKAIDQLIALKVEFIQVDSFNNEWINQVLETKLALYLGEDDKDISSAHLALEKNDNSYAKSSISLTTSREKVLAGGTNKGNINFCKAMSDAKKAMGSVVRILQNVSPETAREAEAPFESKLYTNLTRYEKSYKAEIQNPFLPTTDEAIHEAKRCIQCSCLECVHECSYMQHYKTYPKKALREAYNNLAIAQGNRSANKMINSCTQCGLCAKICPQDLNLGNFLEEARAEMVKMKHMPPTAHEFALEDMAHANSSSIQFFRNNKNNNSNSYVFFPGCQLPTVLPSEVEKTYALLCDELNNDVAFHLGCCGMPASWAQSTEYLNKHIECIKKEWEERNKPSYIFACASCQAFYKKYLPEMNILSVWEVLEKAKISPLANKSKRKFALHDPCSSRDFGAMQESVRSILSSLNQDFEELEYGKSLTRCCGFGGLASEAHESLADTFANERNKETNADLLVYCAICRERMQKVGKKATHILEILFDSAKSEENGNKKLLSLYQRQENRYNFRKNILNTLWNEEEEMQNLDINFTLHDGVEEILSQRKIMHADIALVLQKAKEEGASFYSEESKQYLASYRPRQVSYWVRYTVENDIYHVLDAYSHRMVVPGVKGEGSLPSYTQASCCK